MRHFIYFSSSAQTSGKFDGNLMKAGRMDIAIHSIIQSLFLSHGVRDDVVMHLVFYGMPDPPKHIEIHGKDVGLNKKDVAKVLSKALYKGRAGEKIKVFDGVFVEKKSFLKVVQDLIDDGKEIFILDKKGESLRDIKISREPVFVLGDHDGLPKKELTRLKEVANLVSIGSREYFASQVVAVVNNELDFRGV